MCIVWSCGKKTKAAASACMLCLLLSNARSRVEETLLLSNLFSLDTLDTDTNIAHTRTGQFQIHVAELQGEVVGVVDLDANFLLIGKEGGRTEEGEKVRL